MNISKIVVGVVGGPLIVAAIVVVAVTQTRATKVVQDWSAFQLPAQQCLLSQEVAGSPCQALIRYGVAPEYYLGDPAYRQLIDDHQVLMVTTGAEITDTLARFTLDRSGNGAVKLLKATLEELERQAGQAASGD